MQDAIKPLPAVPPEKCAVLVPVFGAIEPKCDDALNELARRGYVVRRVRGYSQIDLARSQIATCALDDGFEETFWIDADVLFKPDDVDRLRAHGLPLACAIYAKKAVRALACHVLPGTREILFGKGGAESDGHWYLSEGFSFCERARQCGHKVWADTTIRLRHVGGYGYSWEDAGASPARHATYRFRLGDAERQAKG